MFIEELFAKYDTELLYMLKNFCGNAQIAEDALQQAFLKAVLYKDTTLNMPEKAAKAWIFATARNEIIDVIRRRKHIQDDFDLETLLENINYADDCDSWILHNIIVTLRYFHPTSKRVKTRGYMVWQTGL